MSIDAVSINDSTNVVPSQICEIHSISNMRPFLQVTICNQTVSALVDSGASVSAINSAFFKQLTKRFGNMQFAKCNALPIKLTAANGQSMAPSEIRKIPIILPSGKQTRLDVHVIENLNSPLILGINFLKQHKATIDCATNEVQLNELQGQSSQGEDKETEFPLLAKETLVIQPFALVTSTAVISTSSDLPDFGNAGCVSGNDKEILNGIVHINDNAVANIKLINTTYDTRYVHKGDVVGYITQLNNPQHAIKLEKGENGIKLDMQDAAFEMLDLINKENAKLAATVNNKFKTSHMRPIPGKSRPPQVSVLNATTYPKLQKQAPKRVTISKMDFLKQNLRVKAPQEYQNMYWKLVDEFQDVFSENETDLGLTPTIKHTVKMNTDAPIHVKQFTIPFAQRPFIQKKIKDLLIQGIIERANSAYNTPIFAIPKKPVPGQPQGYRLIQDLRKINAHTMLDKFTLQDIKDCIDRVGTRKATVFSSLDLTAGFFQIELDEQSRKYTAFTIPGDGQYQWIRLCLGLHGAPSTFAKLMSLVMSDLPQAMVYLDDVLCASKDHVTHITELRECLLRLRKHNLKLNPFKTELGANEVQYLGYTISEKGITTSDNKHKAIAEFPAPQSKRQIRQFVGLANFYRSLIPNFHKLAGVLTGLTKTLSSYKSGPLPAEAFAAFTKLKQKLCSKPVIAFPNPNLPFQLATDACSGDSNTTGGLGAVLTQKIDGKTRTIAYASRALKDNEKNYSAYLLEKLAVTWAIDHFSVYLKNTRFEVITDHRPVEKLSTVHKKTLDRLHELMNQYECTIRYRPGSMNDVADALSRNAVDQIDAFVESDASSDIQNALGVDVSIPDMQAQDPLCVSILALISAKNLPKDNPLYDASAMQYAPFCHIHKGVLVIFQHSNANDTHPVIVLPKRFIHDVIKQAHCSRFSGHQSSYKTIFRLQQTFWWPTLAKDVKEFCDNCFTCQAVHNPFMFNTRQAPVQPLQVPDGPNQRVHADLFGPLLETENGNKWILVITDAFTKYTNIIAIPNKEAKTVTKAIFDHWICMFTPMKMLITDNGREFANQVNKELCQMLDIKRAFTSSIHPQTNAAAESFNKWIIHYFKTFPIEKENQWEHYLPMVKIAYNTSVHDAISHSPFFLTFARHPQSFSFSYSKPEFSQDSFPKDMAEKMKETFQRVAKLMEEKRNEMIRWQRRTKFQTFKPNQTVLIYFPKETFTGKGKNAKFARNWLPAVIVRKLTDVTYEAHLEKNKRLFACHINRIKPLKEQTFDENLPLARYKKGSNIKPAKIEQNIKNAKRNKPKPQKAPDTDAPYTRTRSRSNNQIAALQQIAAAFYAWQRKEKRKKQKKEQPPRIQYATRISSPEDKGEYHVLSFPPAPQQVALPETDSSEEQTESGNSEEEEQLPWPAGQLMEQQQAERSPSPEEQSDTVIPATPQKDFSSASFISCTEEEGRTPEPSTSRHRSRSRATPVARDISPQFQTPQSDKELPPKTQVTHTHGNIQSTPSTSKASAKPFLHNTVASPILPRTKVVHDEHTHATYPRPIISPAKLVITPDRSFVKNVTIPSDDSDSDTDIPVPLPLELEPQNPSSQPEIPEIPILSSEHRSELPLPSSNSSQTSRASTPQSENSQTDLESQLLEQIKNPKPTTRSQTKGTKPPFENMTPELYEICLKLKKKYDKQDQIDNSPLLSKLPRSVARLLAHNKTPTPRRRRRQPAAAAAAARHPDSSDDEQ